MDEPYRFELIKNKNGIFDDSIGATYIIHLENNGRYEHIMDQLSKYKPSKNVYILFNKGYKKSKKADFITGSTLDLIDAYLTIFKHSIEHEYNNILILEDDFIFDKMVNLAAPEINRFINSELSGSFFYFLGCLPYMSSDFSGKHRKVINSAAAHAIIYSNGFIKDTLRIEQESLLDWDLYLWSNSNKYMYDEPLCYQTFPATENSKNWGSFNVTSRFFGSMMYDMISFVVDEDRPEIGFKFLYERHTKVPKDSILSIPFLSGISSIAPFLK